MYLSYTKLVAEANVCWHIISVSGDREKNFLTWALSLIKHVAVWVLMLTHTQAPHTDALNTHVLENFLLYH